MRVVLYARVSTQRQAEQDLSIPDQFGQLREYSQRNQHEIVREFSDHGASATDDNRPAFQGMMSFVLDRSNEVEAILVLTTSRFFREAYGSQVYKRRLKREGVRVVSITQEVSDDPNGNLIEGIFELIDQHESEINGFHTLRGMKENARQGWFNGSAPPFGYRVESVENGTVTPKRRIVPNPAEAEVVRMVFSLYLDGHEGKRMGIKTLTDHLNSNGSTYRKGKPWTIQRVQRLLADPIYVGECYFNKQDGRTKQPKPKSDWIMIAVEPILERELYDRAAQVRKQNRPSVDRPPKIVGSPALLTGLLHCGKCGARMTMETGKGGAYRYYNCSTYTRRGKSSCEGNRVPQDELEQEVLQHLAAKLFTQERIRAIVVQLGHELSRLRKTNDAKVSALQRQLQDVRVRIHRQHEAIESGVMDIGLVADRLRALKAEEQDLVEQIERARGPRPIPPYLFKESSLHSIQENLETAFFKSGSDLAKRYLNLVLQRVEINGDEVRLEANTAALLSEDLHKAKMGAVNHEGSVPTFVLSWLPGMDSNHQPGG